jgi:hypothetical protein
MAARMTREQARELARKQFEASLEKMIPADESKPLRGGRFGEWEDQLETVIQEVSPVLLEGRAAVEENAQVERAGRCPHCASQNTYLEKQTLVQKRHGPHGSTEVPVQQARCRDCDGSFSPSAAGLGSCGGSAAERPRSPADQPGGGHPIRRGGGAGDQ